MYQPWKIKVHNSWSRHPPIRNRSTAWKCNWCCGSGSAENLLFIFGVAIPAGYPWTKILTWAVPSLKPVPSHRLSAIAVISSEQRRGCKWKQIDCSAVSWTCVGRPATETDFTQLRSVECSGDWYAMLIQLIGSSAWLKDQPVKYKYLETNHLFLVCRG